MDQPVVHATAVIAPGAIVRGRVSIGARAFILFGVVARAELDRIEVGEETNVQDNAVLHCDQGIPCLLGRRVTVGHSAVVHGATVADRALIGIGSLLLNRSSLGEGAWLAAGSVLTEDSKVPAWTLAVGVPAKPVRELTADEVRRADDGVEHYLALGARYAS